MAFTLAQRVRMRAAAFITTLLLAFALMSLTPSVVQAAVCYGSGGTWTCYDTDHIDMGRGGIQGCTNNQPPPGANCRKTCDPSTDICIQLG